MVSKVAALFNKAFGDGTYFARMFAESSKHIETVATSYRAQGFLGNADNKEAQFVYNVLPDMGDGKSRMFITYATKSEIDSLSNVATNNVNAGAGALERNLWAKKFSGYLITLDEQGAGSLWACNAKGWIDLEGSSQSLGITVSSATENSGNTGIQDIKRFVKEARENQLEKSTRVRTKTPTPLIISAAVLAK